MTDNLKLKVKNLKSEWGWTFLFGLGIVIVFFLLRLVNLTILPVFADEAIYIRWAQVMQAEPTLRFLPLSDGKQPLFMWLTIPFLKLITDPLAAGRMVSVMAGFGTIVGIFLLSLKLYQSKRVALLSSFFYTVIPYMVFFDRMALVDSLLAMFGVWVLYFGVLLVWYQRLDLAMITGLILGGALLTKSPATFFALLLPGTAILLLSRPRKDWVISGRARSRFAGQLIKLAGLWLVVYILAFVLYNILRLGPNFQMIALRNKDYVFPVSHFFTNPWDPLQFHLKEIWEWFGIFLTWPVFIGGLAGIVVGLRKKILPSLLVLAWLVLPLFVQAEFAKVFTARYLLFAVPIFLIFAALFADFLMERMKKIVLIGVAVFVLGLILRFDFLILTNPQKAPLPRRERYGYFEEWTAGTGIKEAAFYLKERAKTRKILVGTEGFFGTLPDGLQMYLERVPNITIIGVGIRLTKVPDPLISGLGENEVYLLINDERLALKPEEHNLALVASYPKAARKDGTHQSLLLFLVNSPRTR